jgi:hypothetical protein
MSEKGTDKALVSPGPAWRSEVKTGSNIKLEEWIHLAARITQIFGWRKLTIAAMLTAAAGLAYFNVTRIWAQHVSPFDASSQERTGLPGYMPGTTKWASLRELDADLLTICGPRDQTSGEIERHRRTRTSSIHCRGD